MNFYETHFTEYLESAQTSPIYVLPQLKHFPENIRDLKNIIFYGPSGSGKYSQMIRAISKYSPSQLKYEKKMTVLYDKTPYYFKISDIHYEIDMSLLGCNSKLMWHEIYGQIVDIICSKPAGEKNGIIVCKNFHEIHSELLDNFYSYMQNIDVANTVHIVFILITEELSFIPENIIMRSLVIPVAKPDVGKIAGKTGRIIPDDGEYTHLKMLFTKSDYPDKQEIPDLTKTVCREICDLIDAKCDNLPLIREKMYDILTYNLNIHDCLWIIVKHVADKIPVELLFNKIQTFLQYYNNNYRPIYHLENIIIYIIMLAEKPANIPKIPGKRGRKPGVKNGVKMVT